MNSIIDDLIQINVLVYISFIYNLTRLETFYQRALHFYVSLLLKWDKTKDLKKSIRNTGKVSS